MNAKINRVVVCVCMGLVTACSLHGADAQRRTAHKATKTSRSHSRPVRGRNRSNARTRAQAMKKLNDYNYVKYFGPISGRMYRSTKW